MANMDLAWFCVHVWIQKKPIFQALEDASTTAWPQVKEQDLFFHEQMQRKMIIQNKKFQPESYSTKVDVGSRCQSLMFTQMTEYVIY